MLPRRLPLLFVIALSVPSAAFSQGQHSSVAWRTDLVAARQEAVQTGRPMLLHFWAPWCGPCRRLDSTVFNQPSVIATMHNGFVPIKLNADEFPQIARTYGVEVLPTDVILASDGTILAKFTSPQDPATYVAQIGSAAASNPAAARFAAASSARQSVQAAGPPSVAIGGPMQSNYTSQASQPAVAGPPVQSQTQGYAGTTQSGDPRYGGYAAQDYGNPSMAGPADQAAMHNAQGGASPGNIGGDSYGSRYTMGGGSQQMEASSPGTSGANAYNGGHVQSGDSRASMGSPYGQQSISTHQVGGYAAAEQTGGSPPTVAVENATSPAPSQRPALGLDGFCPVTLKREQRWVAGDKRFGVVHRGRLYLFAGQEQQQQFWNNPDGYCPVLSGIDPVLALDNGATVQGLREHGVEYNGFVYLFSSESTLQHFSRNPERYAGGVRQAMQATGTTTLR